METCIVLLRGVNVGGNNLIKMSELREIASDLGFENPRTLLQSGNLVVEADPARDVGADLSAALLEQRQMKIGVLVRSKSELENIISCNPFPEAAKSDPSHLVVTFLTAEPPKELVEKVKAAIVGPEKLLGLGNHVFVVYPDGIGDSKVAKTPGWNDLMKSGSARNWNTILKLGALAEVGWLLVVGFQVVSCWLLAVGGFYSADSPNSRSPDVLHRCNR